MESRRRTPITTNPSHTARTSSRQSRLRISFCTWSTYVLQLSETEFDWPRREDLSVGVYGISTFDLPYRIVRIQFTIYNFLSLSDSQLNLDGGIMMAEVDVGPIVGVLCGLTSNFDNEGTTTAIVMGMRRWDFDWAWSNLNPSLISMEFWDFKQFRGISIVCDYYFLVSNFLLVISHCIVSNKIITGLLTEAKRLLATSTETVEKVCNCLRVMMNFEKFFETVFWIDAIEYWFFLSNPIFEWNGWLFYFFSHIEIGLVSLCLSVLAALTR